MRDRLEHFDNPVSVFRFKRNHDESYSAIRTTLFLHFADLDPRNRLGAGQDCAWEQPSGWAPIETHAQDATLLSEVVIGPQVPHAGKPGLPFGTACRVGCTLVANHENNRMSDSDDEYRLSVTAVNGISLADPVIIDFTADYYSDRDIQISSRIEETNAWMMRPRSWAASSSFSFMKQVVFSALRCIRRVTIPRSRRSSSDSAARKHDVVDSHGLESYSGGLKFGFDLSENPDSTSTVVKQSGWSRIPDPVRVQHQRRSTRPRVQHRRRVRSEPD